MPSAKGVVELLHYATPFVVFFYYLIDTVIGLCTLRPGVVEGRNPRATVLGLMSVVIVTYICEEGIILSQLSFRANRLATTDSNVYILATLLIWFVLVASLLGSRSSLWSPYYGSWLITLISEMLVLSLGLNTYRPSTGIEYAQVGLEALRLFLLATLPVVTFAFLRTPNSDRGSDEEATPLLGHSQGVSDESQGSAGTYGSTATQNTKGNTSSTSNELIEDLAQQEMKQEQDDRERLSQRLKETGNWWAYAKSYSIFLQYIWPSRSTRLQLNMVGVGLCIGAIRVLNVLVPRQLGQVVDSLGDIGYSRPFLELGIYILLASLESRVGIRALRTYLWLPVEIYASQSIDCASYNHIMSLSSDFHDSKRSGELYKAMQQGQSVIQLLETILYQLAPMIMDLLIACFFMKYLFDAYMVLIVTSTMVFYLWASLHFTIIMTTSRRQYIAAIRRAYQVMYDTMGGWRTVSYFNRMRHAEELYATSTSINMQFRWKNQVIYYISDGLQGLILDFGLFGACFYAIYQVIYENQSVGQFVTLFTYWANLAGPLNTLSSAHRELMGNLVDAEQLLELFMTQPTIRDGPDDLYLKRAQVDFNQVKFSYDGKKQILSGISFHVKAGQTIALIGESGGGKSTILKLLFRFYDVTDGSILIDGQDIRNVTLESLRKCIGVVPQDPSLFNDTIMSNVRYAKLDATNEEVVEACRAAAIHDKIMTFTNGYMSKVGEHGVKLSGGELQRIAIARAILKNPDIILLDEATSSVDSETEGKIQAALDKLSENRTTFIVAHRLSTIVDADLVLVIKEGAILEQGPPAELLKSKGKYYHLWAKQMGIQISTEYDSGEKSSDNDGEVYDLNKSGKGDLSDITTTKDRTQDEDDKTPKPLKRPTPRKASSGKHKVFSAFSKKIFRPDAPEFVPQYQRGTAASGSQEVSHRHSLAGHDQSNEAIAVKGTDKDKKQKSRKRKVKQNDSSVAVNQSINEAINVDGSADAQNHDEAIPSNGAEPQAKRSRFNRRHQSKSEPANQSLLQSQADGTSELDGPPIRSGEARPMKNSFRRVTAPSDPPSGPQTLPTGPQGQGQRRRSRQRHWKARKLDPSGNSGAQGSGTGQDWSSDTPSIGVPAVPFSSPAGGVTPMKELSREPSGSGVRFAHGA
ncbi:hypothetical protein MMC27_000768 [Xylographa pallens]|nr:hypothetical protein [Xylographa pallens]